MFKINFLAFIIPFLFLNTNNNSLVVNYTYSLKMEGFPTATTINSTLFANQESSIYEMDFAGNGNLIEEKSDERGTILSLKSSSNPVIYKNLKEKEIYSLERISYNFFLVKDTTNLYEWTLEKKTKNIIGYVCQKATMHYRGRNYTAYFTTEIPFNNGPWKFNGLPGLILEIKSDDNVFNITANKLQIKNVKSEISNPFSKSLKEAINWSQFINAYKDKKKELKHYRSPTGGTRSIPNKGIEVYIEE